MKTGNIRDFLYESPGPRAQKRIRIITGIVLLGLIVRQFSVTGQFDTKYWITKTMIRRAGLALNEKSGRDMAIREIITTRWADGIENANRYLQERGYDSLVC